MNNTTISANPDPDEPWQYPLMGAPPLSLYPMHSVTMVFRHIANILFCFQSDFYVILSTVGLNHKTGFS